MARAPDPEVAGGAGEGFDHPALQKLGAGQLAPRARTAQGGEQVELGFAQSELRIGLDETFGERRGDPVQAADDAERCDVEVGAHSPPLRLHDIDVVGCGRG